MTRLQSLLPYLVTATVAIILVISNHTIQISLRHDGIYSGFFLLACFLASLSLECFVTAKRKIHTQIGLLTIALYFLHTGFSLPTGAIEITLTLGYLFLAITGIFGAFLCSILAKRLNQMQPRFTPDAILHEREKISQMAEQLFLSAIVETNSQLIEKLYLNHLAQFFGNQTNLLAHLAGTSPSHLTPFIWIELASRSATQEERSSIRDIQQLAMQKFELDRQNILQYANQYWCIFHKVMAWSLLAIIILHIVLVFSFAGPMF